MFFGISLYCLLGGRVNLLLVFGGVVVNIFIRFSFLFRLFLFNVVGVELVFIFGLDNVCCWECRDFGLEKSVVWGCEGEWGWEEGVDCENMGEGGFVGWGCVVGSCFIVGIEVLLLNVMEDINNFFDVCIFFIEFIIVVIEGWWFLSVDNLLDDGKLFGVKFLWEGILCVY